MDFEHATTYNDDDKNEVYEYDVYEKIIETIINSFVHQTSWAEDLRRFFERSGGLDGFSEESRC
jgi:hypothetical protein